MLRLLLTLNKYIAKCGEQDYIFYVCIKNKSNQQHGNNIMYGYSYSTYKRAPALSYNVYNIFNNMNARTTFNSTFLFSYVCVCACTRSCVCMYVCVGNCCCFFSFSISRRLGGIFSLTRFALLICPSLSLSVVILQPSLLLVISSCFIFFYFIYLLYM